MWSPLAPEMNVFDLPASTGSRETRVGSSFAFHDKHRTAILLGCGRPVVRVCHAQGIKDAGLEEFVKPLARNALDEVTKDVEGIAVQPLRSRF